ncbi:hypothetical+protein [Methylocapsa aurea]|uniref:cytochrome b/b6 domain-containing protein n=1 Tax=Methylocapsa aurea TaxID=663610 RepID=UPI003D188301
MTLPEKVRLYHAALAGLALSAYVSGELGPIHEWLGYGVTFILIVRIIWGVVEARQLGISRFFPGLTELGHVRWFDHPAVSKLLLSGVALTLVSTVVTGILADRPTSRLPSLRDEAAISPASEWHAPSNQDLRSSLEKASLDRRENDKNESWITEVHEASANFLLGFVIAHASYMLLFKRRLAAFMLFCAGRRARA